VLAKTKKKRQEAGHTIDQAEIRSRAIVRRLRNVQEVPLAETVNFIEEDQESGQDASPEKGPTQK